MAKQPKIPQDAYTIGYGKPPHNSRFQKGTSGNPTGRPKGSKNLATIVLKESRQQVRVNGPHGTRTIEEVSGLAETSFVLKSVLPQAEQRLFAALGQLALPEDKYYPQTWTFHQEHAVEIKKRLATLGVSTFVRPHR